jgi:hypothetical protein
MADGAFSSPQLSPPSRCRGTDTEPLPPGRVTLVTAPTTPQTKGDSGKTGSGSTTPFTRGRPNCSSLRTSLADSSATPKTVAPGARGALSEFHHNLIVSNIAEYDQQFAGNASVAIPPHRVDGGEG